MLRKTTSYKEYLVRCFPPTNSNIKINEYRLGELCLSLIDLTENFFNDDIAQIESFLSELEALLDKINQKRIVIPWYTQDADQDTDLDTDLDSIQNNNWLIKITSFLSTISRAKGKSPQESAGSQENSNEDSNEDSNESQEKSTEDSKRNDTLLENDLLFRIANYIHTRFVLADDFLSSVLFQTPAYNIYYSLTRNTQCVAYTYEEQQQLNENIFDEDGNPDLNMLEARRALLNRYISVADEEETCYRWFEILKDPSLIDSLTDSLPFSAKRFLPMAQKHLKELKNQLNSCILLSKHLPQYFEDHIILENTVETLQNDDYYLTNGLGDVSQIPIQAKFIGIAFSFHLVTKNPYPALSFLPLKDDENKLYLYPKSMLFCRSISGIVAQELHQCASAKLGFKKCALCNRYFIPRSKTTKFCHRSNPNHDGRPCLDVGPQLNWRKKRSNNPATLKFDKNKHTYYRWKEYNISPPKGKKKPSAETINQIKAIYDSWCSAAENAVKRYTETNPPEENEQLLKVLDLPSLYERSPLLYLELGRKSPK